MGAQRSKEITGSSNAISLAISSIERQAALYDGRVPQLNSKSHLSIEYNGANWWPIRRGLQPGLDLGRVKCVFPAGKTGFTK